MSDWLSQDVIGTAARVLALLYTVVSHELAHGAIALLNGDGTAKEAGRLTLNPLAHIDPMGLLCLVLFRFGWARPVPINPNRFYNERSGWITTSLAGVAMNLLSAFVAICLGVLQVGGVFFRSFFLYVALYGVFFCVFNLLPLPPLDGSKVILALFPNRLRDQIFRYERYTYPLLLILLVTGVLQRVIEPISLSILHGMEYWAVNWFV